MVDHNVVTQASSERHIELLEEQNELLREHLQLTGELIAVVEKLVTHNNGQAPATTNSTAVVPQESLVAEGKTISSIPKLHPDDVENVVAGTNPVEKSIFWPTRSKTKHGWVRIRLTYETDEDLAIRVKKGCICGRKIVSKHTSSGEEFFGCEAASSNGGCPYRPYVDVVAESITFNMPHQDIRT